MVLCETFKNENDRDRMENEEVITSLVFLEYSKRINDQRKTFDLYQKKDRISSRVSKRSVTLLFKFQTI